MMKLSFAASFRIRSCAFRLDSGLRVARDGYVLLKVLVKIDVIGSKHYNPRSRLYRDELRSVSMLSAGIAGDSRNNRLIVALNKMNAAFHVHLHVRQNVLTVDSAVGTGRMPGLARVIHILIPLHPNASLREEISPVGMVPMHVCHDHVRNVFRLNAGLLNSFRWLLKIPHLPLPEELFAVKARVNQDVTSVSPHQPHHHGNVHFPGWIRASHQPPYGEINDSSVAYGIHCILRLPSGSTLGGRNALRGKQVEAKDEAREKTERTGQDRTLF